MFDLHNICFLCYVFLILYLVSCFVWIFHIDNLFSALRLFKFESFQTFITLAKHTTYKGYRQGHFTNRKQQYKSWKHVTKN